METQSEGCSWWRNSTAGSWYKKGSDRELSFNWAAKNPSLLSVSVRKSAALLPQAGFCFALAHGQWQEQLMDPHRNSMTQQVSKLGCPI